MPMEKKRISIVINPQYMKENRVKIEQEQAEADKVYNRWKRFFLIIRIYESSHNVGTGLFTRQ